MSEHFLGSNKGFEILANSVQNPLPSASSAVWFAPCTVPAYCHGCPSSPPLSSLIFPHPTAILKPHRWCFDFSPPRPILIPTRGTPWPSRRLIPPCLFQGGPWAHPKPRWVSQRVFSHLSWLVVVLHLITLPPPVWRRLRLSSCRCLSSSTLIGYCIAATTSACATGQAMTQILWICLSDELISAALPEPSPGKTGLACLWIDVGRRRAQGEGGSKQDWRMGRANRAACDRNTIFEVALCTQWCTISTGYCPQGKIWGMQSHGQVLTPCDCITIPCCAGIKTWCINAPSEGDWGGSLITTLVGERISGANTWKIEFWFLEFVFEQVGTDLKNKKPVKQQHHKLGCGKK